LIELIDQVGVSFAKSSRSTRGRHVVQVKSIFYY